MSHPEAPNRGSRVRRTAKAGGVVAGLGEVAILASGHPTVPAGAAPSAELPPLAAPDPTVTRPAPFENLLTESASGTPAEPHELVTTQAIAAELRAEDLIERRTVSPRRAALPFVEQAVQPPVQTPVVERAYFERPKRLVIAPGDTVWDLAEKYGMTPGEFAVHYGIRNPHEINAGDEYVWSDEPAPAAVLEVAPAPHADSPADPDSPARHEDPVFVSPSDDVIKPTDGLSQQAAVTETPGKPKTILAGLRQLYPDDAEKVTSVYKELLRLYPEITWTDSTMQQETVDAMLARASAISMASANDGNTAGGDFTARRRAQLDAERAARTPSQSPKKEAKTGPTPTPPDRIVMGDAGYTFEAGGGKGLLQILREQNPNRSYTMAEVQEIANNMGLASPHDMMAGTFYTIPAKYLGPAQTPGVVESRNNGGAGVGTPRERALLDRSNKVFSDLHSQNPKLIENSHRAVEAIAQEILGPHAASATPEQKIAARMQAVVELGQHAREVPTTLQDRYTLNRRSIDTVIAEHPDMDPQTRIYFENYGEEGLPHLFVEGLLKGDPSVSEELRMRLVSRVTTEIMLEVNVVRTVVKDKTGDPEFDAAGFQRSAFGESKLLSGLPPETRAEIIRSVDITVESTDVAEVVAKYAAGEATEADVLATLSDRGLAKEMAGISWTDHHAFDQIQLESPAIPEVPDTYSVKTEPGKTVMQLVREKFPDASDAAVNEIVKKHLGPLNPGVNLDTQKDAGNKQVASFTFPNLGIDKRGNIVEAANMGPGAGSETPQEIQANISAIVTAATAAALRSDDPNMDKAAYIARSLGRNDYLSGLPEEMLRDLASQLASGRANPETVSANLAKWAQKHTPGTAAGPAAGVQSSNTNPGAGGDPNAGRSPEQSAREPSAPAADVRAIASRLHPIPPNQHYQPEFEREIMAAIRESAETRAAAEGQDISDPARRLQYEARVMWEVEAALPKEDAWIEVPRQLRNIVSSYDLGQMEGLGPYTDELLGQFGGDIMTPTAFNQLLEEAGYTAEGLEAVSRQRYTDSLSSLMETLRRMSPDARRTAIYDENNRVFRNFFGNLFEDGREAVLTRLDTLSPNERIPANLTNLLAAVNIGQLDDAEFTRALNGNGDFVQAGETVSDVLRRNFRTEVVPNALLDRVAELNGMTRKELDLVDTHQIIVLPDAGTARGMLADMSINTNPGAGGGPERARPLRVGDPRIAEIVQRYSSSSTVTAEEAGKVNEMVIDIARGRLAARGIDPTALSPEQLAFEVREAADTVTNLSQVEMYEYDDLRRMILDNAVNHLFNTSPTVDPYVRAAAWIDATKFLDKMQPISASSEQDEITEAARDFINEHFTLVIQKAVEAAVQEVSPGRPNTDPAVGQLILEEARMNLSLQPVFDRMSDESLDHFLKNTVASTRILHEVAPVLVQFINGEATEADLEAAVNNALLNPGGTQMSVNMNPGAGGGPENTAAGSTFVGTDTQLAARLYPDVAAVTVRAIAPGGITEANRHEVESAVVQAAAERINASGIRATQEIVRTALGRSLANPEMDIVSELVRNTESPGRRVMAFIVNTEAAATAEIDSVLGLVRFLNPGISNPDANRILDQVAILNPGVDLNQKMTRERILSLIVPGSTQSNFSVNEGGAGVGVGAAEQHQIAAANEAMGDVYRRIYPAEHQLAMQQINGQKITDTDTVNKMLADMLRAHLAADMTNSVYNSGDPNALLNITNMLPPDVQAAVHAELDPTVLKTPEQIAAAAQRAIGIIEATQSELYVGTPPSRAGAVYSVNEFGPGSGSEDPRWNLFNSPLGDFMTSQFPQVVRDALAADPVAQSQGELNHLLQRQFDRIFSHVANEALERNLTGDQFVKYLEGIMPGFDISPYRFQISQQFTDPFGDLDVSSQPLERFEEIEQIVADLYENLINASMYGAAERQTDEQLANAFRTHHPGVFDAQVAQQFPPGFQQTATPDLNEYNRTAAEAYQQYLRSVFNDAYRTGDTTQVEAAFSAFDPATAQELIEGARALGAAETPEELSFLMGVLTEDAKARVLQEQARLWQNETNRVEHRDVQTPPQGPPVVKPDIRAGGEGNGTAVQNNPEPPKGNAPSNPRQFNPSGTPIDVPTPDGPTANKPVIESFPNTQATPGMQLTRENAAAVELGDVFDNTEIGLILSENLPLERRGIPQSVMATGDAAQIRAHGDMLIAEARAMQAAATPPVTPGVQAGEAVDPNLAFSDAPQHGTAVRESAGTAAGAGASSNRPESNSLADAMRENSERAAETATWINDTMKPLEAELAALDNAVRDPAMQARAQQLLEEGRRIQTEPGMVQTAGAFWADKVRTYLIGEENERRNSPVPPPPAPAPVPLIP